MNIIHEPAGPWKRNEPPPPHPLKVLAGLILMPLFVILGAASRAWKAIRTAFVELARRLTIATDILLGRPVTIAIKIRPDNDYPWCYCMRSEYSTVVEEIQNGEQCYPGQHWGIEPEIMTAKQVADLPEFEGW